jgi:hypothetical protein
MPVRVLAGPARGIRLMTGPRTQNYYWRGGHEPAVPRALAQLLKPGHTFWDVGAHIGYVSCSVLDWSAQLAIYVLLSRCRPT